MAEVYRGVMIQGGDSFRVMDRRSGELTTVTRYRATVRGEVVRGRLEEVKAKIDASLVPAGLKHSGSNSRVA